MLWGPTYFEQWNFDFGLYDRIFTSTYMDVRTASELNSDFDVVYADGGIYHAWGHPGKSGWEPGGNAYEHIQYVKGKMDVWYVGLGALYAYDYTRMHVKQVMMDSISSS